MKRDLELIRKIVLMIEGSSGGGAPEIRIEGYSDDVIGYHCYLIFDAGLAEGCDLTVRDSNGPQYELSHLTWAGHEFAEAARDNGRWKQALEVVKDKGGTVTLSVLIELLKSLMKSSFGLS